MELATHDPAATRRLAGAVATILRRGDVVALTGELGAGKTCFVQGAAAALGVEDRVTSPSFILRRDYEGDDVAVTHLDVYRLETLQEVLDIGYAEQVDDAVVFVEWGDAMAPLLPTDHLEVELRLPAPERLPDPVPNDADAPEGPDPAAEERRITLRPHGDSWRRRLAGLEDALGPWQRRRQTAP